jgi:hypothetical protein
VSKLHPLRSSANHNEPGQRAVEFARARHEMDRVRRLAPVRRFGAQRASPNAHRAVVTGRAHFTVASSAARHRVGNSRQVTPATGASARDTSRPGRGVGIPGPVSKPDGGSGEGGPDEDSRDKRVVTHGTVARHIRPRG